MIGAEAAVQAAARAAMLAEPLLAGLAGVYDGPPPRAALPYASFGPGAATDWSTKTETGREVRLAINLWDDGETPARLAELCAAAQAAVARIGPDLEGWRIVSLVFLRTTTVRSATGPWAALVEFRVRVLATS